MSAPSDDNHDSTKDNVVKEDVWDAVCEGGGNPHGGRSQHCGLCLRGAALPAGTVPVCTNYQHIHSLPKTWLFGVTTVSFLQREAGIFVHLLPLLIVCYKIFPKFSPSPWKENIVLSDLCAIY